MTGEEEEALARPTFETLYRVARESLPRMPWLSRFQAADMDDLIHDTVLVAHARVGTYAPRFGALRSLTAWLLAIAWRLAARRGKRAYRSREALGQDVSEIPAPAEAWPTGERHALLAQRRRLLTGILEAIDRRRVEPFVMHHLIGMTVPEIAAELALNPNTVKSRMARARVDAMAAIEELAHEERSMLDEPAGPHPRAIGSGPASVQR